jgi:RNA polymerase sigma-70 factor (ECF subfamily)
MAWKRKPLQALEKSVNDLDPAWILQAQRGNSEAFDRLLEHYQKPVYNLCYRMLGDPVEAEDAAQETFLRAYSNLNRYDRARAFSTWLLSIAAHHCIDQIRKRRMRLVSIDSNPFDPDSDEAYLELPDSDPGPETRTVQRETQQRVQALLAELNPQDRAAIVMLYWYDFSYEEIASALGMTVSAVKSRLHRARHVLAGGWEAQEAQGHHAERSHRDERIQTPAF